ncbi:bifunctional diaminohydroxyphosphoribosylaminopyrimidine deaminase/5-amino-6-(5-phosphoribosylamino)uracil reductase RibD [Rhizobiaceae bacterium BDR2-2]|uniref:Riboflavin biosynthesis protein RibD n=1 Tax=Ectorhizobium quercum TaxID=2965071 RepID=A0AAE3N2G8_9HYPH|nr:bifunctional diaminohydroxyphosphoribosylaminopyrimidine deaminase/5-amino-6-(5-phosphoribosylamino)uracil reductase RibD [Ectorhizobium quercum]MCX8998976.1 bifunctional diaminohydroxyphosphoribosylaminopyrimidine deaminase/5-amino-6-(5-phosphoribosylamino)uracil reductase RibD [Ectorhizobium quercum]
MSAADDRRFMAVAIRLSRWHAGRTTSNPSVGCVVVKDGIIVGRGVTARSGRPHAEPQALADAGERARGATAYVTLEPCSHHGRTPPCSDALIAVGVARVVVALTDPDPRVSGRGLRLLAEAGIEVESGVMEEEARRALAPYLTRQTKKRAHVTLKLAVSADGMIGLSGAGQVAITGPAARAQVHMLRAESDAILVGIGTAIADDPELTCRLPGLEKDSPARIVLDRDLRLPLASKLVRTAAEVPVIAVASSARLALDAGFSERRAALELAGVQTVEAGSIAAFLAMLADWGVSGLIVEGGATVAAAFLEADLVDRIQLYEGAVTIGPQGIASPLTRAHIGSGFAFLGESRFGPDRRFDYERI